MKICWDNLEKLKYRSDRNQWQDKKWKHHFYYECICIYCKNNFLSRNKNSICCNDTCKLKGKYHFNYGRRRSENIKNKISKKLKGIKRGKRGKIKSKCIGKYSGYDKSFKKLKWIEKLRRNENNKNILEVKCTYCGLWFKPTKIQVQNRIAYIDIDGQKFYCSDECKQQCPIYSKNGARLIPKDHKKATSREVQPELRQMVFKRDNWICQKCKSKKSLHCHHVEGIKYEPIESADIDKCITLCKKCHNDVHKKEGCLRRDLICKKL